MLLPTQPIVICLNNIFSLTVKKSKMIQLQNPLYRYINCTQCTITVIQYIYLNVSSYLKLTLHPICLFFSWPNLRDNQKTNSDSPVSLNTSFCYFESPKTSTPSKSWLRITGTNSPKPLLKSNSVHQYKEVRYVKIKLPINNF